MIDVGGIAAAGGSAVFTLPLDRVLEDRSFNVRIFYGDIDLLAVQLMTEGQHEPIKVRREDQQYFIVDGHRRQRAFARSRQLRIEHSGERYLVFEGDKLVREASGPVHRRFNPDLVQCRQIEPGGDEGELFASQLIYNSGKPFTVLERMLFLSRLSRQGAYTKEQLALKTGFSRTHVANAQALHSADPRLLEYVREGRISQKLALRLLRAFSAEQQIGRIRDALAVAEKCQRDKILPKDLAWREESNSPASGSDSRPRTDPVRIRLRGLATRLEEAMRFPPNPSAEQRLGTLALVQRYVVGKVSYARLEAFLLGRE